MHFLMPVIFYITLHLDNLRLYRQSYDRYIDKHVSFSLICVGNFRLFFFFFFKFYLCKVCLTSLQVIIFTLEKPLILGKIGGKMRRGWQRMRQLDGITDSMDMSLSSRSKWWTGKPVVLQSMGSQRVAHDWAAELNCTEFASVCPNR